MKHIFRASYSILKLWDTGQKSEAIKSYFKLSRFVTKEMEDGINYHKQWEDEIKRTKCLPKIFGSRQLIDPQVEMKLEMPITDWCEFVFKPDLVDGFRLTDFKTGTKEIGYYVDDYQLPVYALFLAKKGINVDRGVIRKYNQYEKTVETGFTWFTPAKLAEAKKWLIKNITEMSDHFEAEGLFDKYPNPREVATFEQ